MTSGTDPQSDERFRFGPFRLEVRERLLFENGTPVRLAAKTFDLLLVLLRHAGHLLSRDELIEALWPDTVVEEANLTWNVNALRRSLGDSRRSSRYIETVRGHGYRFIAEVMSDEQVAESTEAGTPDPPATGRRPADGTFDLPARRRRWRSQLAMLAALLALAVAALLVWHFASQPTESEGATAGIAVLPFQNLSADRSNAYFAAGIRDTILSKLAGIASLRVISRTSTDAYSSHPTDLRRVGAQLGVGSVLEGSVQKAGDRVLINVQLIDVASGGHVWARVYTRSLADVFAVENDVANQVATALQAKLLPGEAVRIARAPTGDPQAYLLYLKADYYADQITGSHSAANPAKTAKQAVDLYRQAVARDPRFALAWARLSYLQSYAYWYQIARAPHQMNEAEAAARRSLALAPDLPQAHLALGYVQYYGHRNFAGALKQFEQAHEFLPNDAAIVGAIAYIHRRQGRWQEALAQLRRAALLDPRNPRWPYDAGFSYMALRDYREAAQHFDQALALEPSDYDAAAFKALAFLLAGDPLAQIRKVLATIPAGADPRGSIAAVRYEAAWLARNPQMALKAIAMAPDWVVAADAVGLVPATLLRAQAQELAGNSRQAQAKYREAATLLQKAISDQPNNPDLWSFLALTQAGLGETQPAIRAADKATSILPATRDALAGPSHLLTLAKTYARIGKPAAAVRLLRRLLAMPAGGFVSVSMLRRDPIWDPIRNDPAFQSLLKAP